MNRKPRALALAAVSLVCIMILAACGDSTPVLRYITIAPATANIEVGTTQQFTATGYYSNGSTTPNMSVTWGSSTPAVATIDATGVATAVASGTTTITATAFGITATSATLNVNQLTTIAVTPTTATVAIGATVPFTAKGTFKNADGTTSSSDITAEVTWNSGTPAVATIDDYRYGHGRRVGCHCDHRKIGWHHIQQRHSDRPCSSGVPGHYSGRHYDRRRQRHLLLRSGKVERWHLA